MCRVNEPPGWGDFGFSKKLSIFLRGAIPFLRLVLMHFIRDVKIQYFFNSSTSTELTC